MKKLLTIAFVFFALTSYGQYTKYQLYQKIDQMSTYRVDYMRALSDSIVKSMALQSSISNVDNTSDANKPVSTAQATAIAAKVADAINDGTTTVAPSQNAVFDALALKLNSTISYKTESNDHTLDADDLSDLAEGKNVYFFMSKASASTLTLPSDATLAIPVGASFVVMRTHASGLVTFAAGSGASASGAAGVLTDAGLNVAIRVHKTSANTWIVQNGAPGTWFDYTPAFTGFSVNPVIAAARYTVIGKTCFVRLSITTAGTSNATTYTVTMPFNSAAVGQQHSSWSFGVDGSPLTNEGRVTISAGSNVASILKTHDTATLWTASGSKSASMNLFYEIE